MQDDSGTYIAISIQALEHVIGKYRLKPDKRGGLEIKNWMLLEILDFDNARGFPAPPQVIEDLRRVVEGKAPIHNLPDGFELFDLDGDGQIH